MTPNEALRELRVALSILLPRRARLLALAPKDYKRDELDDLIDAAVALDEWLSKGGELPDAWDCRSEPDPFPAHCRCGHPLSEHRGIPTIVGGAGMFPHCVAWIDDKHPRTQCPCWRYELKRKVGT